MAAVTGDHKLRGLSQQLSIISQCTRTSAEFAPLPARLGASQGRGRGVAGQGSHLWAEEGSSTELGSLEVQDWVSMSLMRDPLRF